MQRLLGRSVEGPAALGLLIIRVVFGAGMIMHSWKKIQAPFSWMGPDSNIPGPLQALAALGEFGGGLGLLLGFLTPLACFGILSVMIGAWWISHRGDPWIAPGQRTFELPSLYATVALALLITGPGRLSVDALLWGKKKG